MSIRSVLTGLFQFAKDPRTRPLADCLLTNSRVQAHESTRLVTNPKMLNRLLEFVSHYEEDGEEGPQAVLRFAAGSRDKFTLYRFWDNADALEKELKDILKPASAKGLLRLADAVTKAEPPELQDHGMFNIKKGDFVRFINVGGKAAWGTIGKDYCFSTRPVTYFQFEPLARAIGLPLVDRPSKEIRPNDPVLNYSPQEIDTWIDVLKTLSGQTYRLPSELEWERGTASNYKIVPLNGRMLREWKTRYANAFLGNPDAPLILGGSAVNDEKVISKLLSGGLFLSACDFSENTETRRRTESCYECVTTDHKSGGIHMRHVGFRYFANRSSLAVDETSPLRTNLNTIFRLVKDV